LAKAERRKKRKKEEKEKNQNTSKRKKMEAGETEQGGYATTLYVPSPKCDPAL
jgi:hypothetical protein